MMVKKMVKRIWNHPILGEFKPKKQIIFYLDNIEIKAYEGDSIASALWANNIKVFKYSEKYHEPRGLYCAIGLCNSCTMIVEGIPNVRTCIFPVKQGLHVKRSNGR